MRGAVLFFLFILQLGWSQGPLASLENSPRHHEWVTLNAADKPIKSFLVSQVNGNTTKKIIRYIALIS